MIWIVLRYRANVQLRRGGIPVQYQVRIVEPVVDIEAKQARFQSAHDIV